MSPITFTVRMNMNSENTSGKNFIPSVPAVLRRVWETNSYEISATDCSRPGTRARALVAPSVRNRITASAISMNAAEFVNANSTLPMRPKVKILLTWN